MRAEDPEWCDIVCEKHFRNVPASRTDLPSNSFSLNCGRWLHSATFLSFLSPCLSSYSLLFFVAEAQKPPHTHSFFSSCLVLDSQTHDSRKSLTSLTSNADTGLESVAALCISQTLKRSNNAVMLLIRGWKCITLSIHGGRDAYTERLQYLWASA